MSLNHHTPPPTPGPLCVIYRPQLALLALGKLDEHQEADVRAHVAGCEYCQVQLREYEIVRAAVARHFGVAPTALQESTRPGARHRTESLAASAPFTLEDIMQAANTAPTPTPTSEHPSTARALSPRQRGLTFLGAIAAVLVLTVLVASLFSYFGSHGTGPAVKPTPTRGLDAQSQAYLTVLQTYYQPEWTAVLTDYTCHAPTASDTMRNCQPFAAPVVTAAQALKSHLTVTPPTRWQTADTQIKRATDDVITGYSAVAAATTVNEWTTARTQAQDAFQEYCAPVSLIDEELVPAGLPLSSLLSAPSLGSC